MYNASIFNRKTPIRHTSCTRTNYKMCMYWSEAPALHSEQCEQMAKHMTEQEVHSWDVCYIRHEPACAKLTIAVAIYCLTRNFREMNHQRQRKVSSFVLMTFQRKKKKKSYAPFATLIRHSCANMMSNMWTMCTACVQVQTQLFTLTCYCYLFVFVAGAYRCRRLIERHYIRKISWNLYEG